LQAAKRCVSAAGWVSFDFMIKAVDTDGAND
jgi:hypothetical protein